MRNTPKIFSKSETLSEHWKEVDNQLIECKQEASKHTRLSRMAGSSFEKQEMKIWTNQRVWLLHTQQNWAPSHRIQECFGTEEDLVDSTEHFEKCVLNSTERMLKFWHLTWLGLCLKCAVLSQSFRPSLQNSHWDCEIEQWDCSHYEVLILWFPTLSEFVSILSK